MKYLIIILILTACGKSTLWENPNELKRYDMVVDHHSLDTTKLYHRYIWDLGYLEPKEAIKIDTAKDMWYINCATLDTLEHLYYLRNGLKINSK